MKHLVTLLLLSSVSVASGTLLVDTVDPGSPADAAGLQAGDYIIRLDGREIATHDDLKEVMAAHQPGDSVPLTVRRGDETVDLTLTFGERPGGGISIGVRLSIMMQQGAHGEGQVGEGSVQCLAWIDEIYRIDSLTRDLGLDLSEEYEAMRGCVGHDTRGLTTDNANKYCDNIFKIHCSGLELLTEVGEGLVQRCEDLLNESLGLNLAQYKGWKTCGQREVFDRYSRLGRSSDRDACQAAYLNKCGTNLDAAIKTGETSPERRGFLDCCSAEGFDVGSTDCGMIDDSFARGPCHDRPVWVNWLTSEWIHCSALE
jgi:hypothetical protein